MTVDEIEKSGINDATIFTVTLKNGFIVTFRSSINHGKFHNFYPANNTIISSNSNFFKISKIDDQWWIPMHNTEQIVIKGEDIINIKVLETNEETKKFAKAFNSEDLLGPILIIAFLISMFMTCTGRL